MGIIYGLQMPLYTHNKGNGYYTCVTKSLYTSRIQVRSEVKMYMVLYKGDLLSGHAKTFLNWNLKNSEENVLLNFIIYVTITKNIKLNLMVSAFYQPQSTVSR
jgi:hypothetical protein